MSIQEISLIEKCKKGDVESFEQLIAEYQKKAFNIAYRMLGNIEDASDITQEALVKVYKSIHKFEGNSKFSTWLYSIVTNTCIDFIRKSKKGNVVFLDREYDLGESKSKIELPDEDNTPERVFEKKEIQRVIHDAINQLGYEQRQIIILRDINGFSYQQISEILNCAEGTVKSRINRARKNLKLLVQDKMVIKI